MDAAKKDWDGKAAKDAAEKKKETDATTALSTWSNAEAARKKKQSAAKD